MDPGSRARRAQVRDDATVASVPQPPASSSSAGDRYSRASSGAERGEKAATELSRLGGNSIPDEVEKAGLLCVRTKAEHMRSELVASNADNAVAGAEILPQLDDP
jgi:hypothetical protein